MTTDAMTYDATLLRQETQNASKTFKSSWIKLGQYLFNIHRDKLYKDWGYLSFETYCMKEIGIKQTTAAKLLKSYYFLEQEEPKVVTERFQAEESPKKMPDYESVNLLRLAKENKKVAAEDLSALRHSVIEQGKEPKEVRAQIKKMIEVSEEQSGGETDEEARAAKRKNSIQKLILTLRNYERNFEEEDLLPDSLIKQIDALVKKLEDQIL